MAIAYAVFGLVAFLLFVAGGDQYLTLPFGVVAPLVHLNLNFNVERSTGLLYNIFLCVAATVSYSLTGWATGAVGALLFNVIAKHTGGIDAKYFSATNKVSANG